MVRKKVYFCLQCYHKHKVEIHEKNGVFHPIDNPNANQVIVVVGSPTNTEYKCDWCKQIPRTAKL